MSIEVRIPPIIRQYTEGARVVQVDGKTVSELLDNLETKYPGIKGQLFTADNKMHRFVNIYINDEDIRFMNSLDTEVADGDVVSILPAVAGGR